MVGYMLQASRYACRTLVGSLHEETDTPCQDVAESVSVGDGWRIHVVLDGHGPKGEEVAKLGASVLLSQTAERLREDRGRAWAVRESFREAAERIESGEEAADSGATASVVVVGGGGVCVGNVGDSTVVWGRGGREAVVLSENHRAVEEAEQKRVEKCGGVVQNGYLSDGEAWGKMISVTRALGDLDVRAIGVVSEPFVTEVKVEGEEDFIILATDGLWDAHGGVSPQRAVDVVRKVLQEDGEGIAMAVDELMAVAKGRCRLPIDDAAICVIKLGAL